MSYAPHALALATQSNGALAEWRVVANRSGVVDLIETQPAAQSAISIWSLLDESADWPSEPDRLQIELVSTLPWLEEHLSKRFGDTFANEMGKTVSVFLHRLIPEGRKFGSGFPIGEPPTSDRMSIQQLADFVLSRGVPFLRNVASGEAFLDVDLLPPTLLDPVNWSVRRVVALVTLGHEPSASSLLASLAPKVERDLEAKYLAIAAVSRDIDAAERVRDGLRRFNRAVQFFARADA